MTRCISCYQLLFIISTFIAQINGALIQQRTSSSVAASPSATVSGFQMNVGFGILFSLIGVAVLLGLVYMFHACILRRNRSRSSVSTPIDDEKLFDVKHSFVKPFYLKADIKLGLGFSDKNIVKIKSQKSVDDIKMFDLEEGVTVSTAIVSDAPPLDFEAVARAASIKRTVGVGRRYSERTLQNGKHSRSNSMDALPMYKPRDLDSHIPIPVYLPITKPLANGRSETTYVLPPMSIITPKPNVVNLDIRPATFHEEPRLPHIYPRALHPQNLTHKRVLSTPAFPSPGIIRPARNNDQVHRPVLPRAPATTYTSSLLNNDHRRSRLSKIEEKAWEQDADVSSDTTSSRMSMEEGEDMSQALNKQRRQNRPPLSIITDNLKLSPPPYRQLT